MTAFEIAVERYLQHNPNPDNCVRPTVTKKVSTARKSKITAQSKSSTRYGRGGGFKSGKGKYS